MSRKAKDGGDKSYILYSYPLFIFLLISNRAENRSLVKSILFSINLTQKTDRCFIDNENK